MYKPGERPADAAKTETGEDNVTPANTSAEAQTTPAKTTADAQAAPSNTTTSSSKDNTTQA